MKKYTKIYFDFFKLDISSFIECEICGAEAVDIAHIIAKSKFGTKRKEEQDKIENLIALCRKHHYEYDFENKFTKEELYDIHKRNMEKYSGFR